MAHTAENIVFYTGIPPTAWNAGWIAVIIWYEVAYALAELEVQRMSAGLAE